MGISTATMHDTSMPGIQVCCNFIDLSPRSALHRTSRLPRGVHIQGFERLILGNFHIEEDLSIDNEAFIDNTTLEATAYPDRFCRPQGRTKKNYDSKPKSQRIMTLNLKSQALSLRGEIEETSCSRCMALPNKRKRSAEIKHLTCAESGYRSCGQATAANRVCLLPPSSQMLGSPRQ